MRDLFRHYLDSRIEVYRRVPDMPDMGKKISYLVPKTAQMPAVAVNQVVIQTWNFNLFTKPEHRRGNGAAAGVSEHEFPLKALKCSTASLNLGKPGHRPIPHRTQYEQRAIRFMQLVPDFFPDGVVGFLDVERDEAVAMAGHNARAFRW